MIVLNISPIAFSIGSFSIRWYGIMIALAVVVLILWMARETKRAVGLSYEPVLNGALVAIPSGIVVSKLLHVIDAWSYYQQNPALILNAEGLTIYGAVLGATLGLWIYSRVNKYPFGHAADLLAPGILLAQAIGRVGCTLNGCCYGAPTSLPWGVIYTNPESYAPIGVAVHPTQVYEIIYNLIIFGVLFKLRGRLKPNGALFALYLSLYSVWRVGIGFIREGTVFAFELQQAQVLGIIVLAITIPLFIYWKRRQTAMASP